MLLSPLSMCLCPHTIARQIAVLVVMTLATELNAFMMLNALDVPKTSIFNTVRLGILFLVGLPAVSEYYEYITNPDCTRLGQVRFLTDESQLQIIKASKANSTALVRCLC